MTPEEIALMELGLLQAQTNLSHIQTLVVVISPIIALIEARKWRKQALESKKMDLGESVAQASSLLIKNLGFLRNMTRALIEEENEARKANWEKGAAELFDSRMQMVILMGTLPMYAKPNAFDQGHEKGSVFDQTDEEVFKALVQGLEKVSSLEKRLKELLKKTTLEKEDKDFLSNDDFPEALEILILFTRASHKLASARSQKISLRQKFTQLYAKFRR